MAAEPAAVTPGKNRPIDVAVGLGINKWTSGLNIKGSAPTQFAWSVGGGFTFGDVFAGASFRAGLLITHSTLDEGTGPTKNTLGFTSFLVEPSVRLRLVDHRLYFTGALGIGGLSISGLRTTSVVLDPKVAVKSISGSIGAFELRPAIGLQLHITDGLVLFTSAAVSTAAKPQYFYQSLGRFELLFGPAYLF
jgi:hypothetical protein